MKRFQVQSKYDCEIIFTYGDNGVLRGFEITKDVELSTIGKILNTRPPFNVDYFLEVCRTHKIKFSEIMPDLSFSAFWNAYGYKEGGSKKRAEQLWNKLSDAKKSMALSYIPKYDKHLALGNIAKAYATTYLNGEYFIK